MASLKTWSAKIFKVKGHWSFRLKSAHLILGKKAKKDEVGKGWLKGSEL
jgi:hypothetical protein